MGILSATHWDIIIVLKEISGTTRLYAVFFVVLVGYASFTLVRVFARLYSPGGPAALALAKRRISNVRQIVVLLLLLFGMTVANDSFNWFHEIRLLQSPCGDCAGVDPFSLWGATAFAVLASLLFVHVLQWIASARLERLTADLSG